MKKVVFNMESEFLVTNKEYEEIMKTTKIQIRAIEKALMEEIKSKKNRIKRLEFTSIKGEE